MMKLVAAFALGFVLAHSSAVKANDMPTTKADCEKAHMTWDEAHGKCVK